MSQTEFKQLESTLKKTLKKVKTDKNFSKKLLAKTGIYQKNGKLSKNYV